MDWREEEMEETEEAKEQVETNDAPPPGWRPSQDTIRAIQGEHDASTEPEWVDRGIQDVPVDLVETTDMAHVRGSEDFHKVPYEDMVDGFHKLETVVRPAVEEGKGGDYFYELDQIDGNDYANGYQRVYDAFYGHEAIRLEKDGETYRVINGAHRLYVAKHLGIHSVPARVIERQR